MLRWSAIRGSMIPRRAAASVLSSHLAVSRRSLCAAPCCCTLSANLSQHFYLLFDGATYMSAGALLTSPIGTVALLLLSYNLCVVGTKHLWYTLEMTFKDYGQDVLLQQAIRYCLLLCLIIATTHLFIEA